MANEAAIQNWDLCRITKAKREVDISHNTIRAYAKRGLRIYRHGRATYFSRAELAEFIKTRANVEVMAGGAH